MMKNFDPSQTPEWEDLVLPEEPDLCVPIGLDKNGDTLTPTKSKDPEDSYNRAVSLLRRLKNPEGEHPDLHPLMFMYAIGLGRMHLLSTGQSVDRIRGCVKPGPCMH